MASGSVRARWSSDDRAIRDRRLLSVARSANVDRGNVSVQATMRPRHARADGSPAGLGPILVVESDPQLGRAILEQLHADGYRAELARSAEHARVLANRNGPKLVVLGDLDSSRGALELLEEIRAADRGHVPWERGLPAIVVGPQSEELDMLRAFEAGADDFLARPARYLELRARLRATRRQCA